MYISLSILGYNAKALFAQNTKTFIMPKYTNKMCLVFFNRIIYVYLSLVYFRPSHKKRKGRRIASHSSSSSDDAESLSPLPRVRSIEANLEFPNTASATIRSVKRAPNWRGQLRHQLMLQQHQQPQLFPAETTNFL